VYVVCVATRFLSLPWWTFCARSLLSRLPTAPGLLSCVLLFWFQQKHFAIGRELFNSR
jgi:hypothetical protein